MPPEKSFTKRSVRTNIFLNRKPEEENRTKKARRELNPRGREQKAKTLRSRKVPSHPFKSLLVCSFAFDHQKSTGIMKKEMLKSPPITAFTPDGDYLAILSPNETVKASSFTLCSLCGAICGCKWKFFAMLVDILMLFTLLVSWGRFLCIC